GDLHCRSGSRTDHGARAVLRRAVLGSDAAVEYTLHRAVESGQRRGPRPRDRACLGEGSVVYNWVLISGYNTLLWASNQRTWGLARAARRRTHQLASPAVRQPIYKCW